MKKWVLWVAGGVAACIGGWYFYYMGYFKKLIFKSKKFKKTHLLYRQHQGPLESLTELFHEIADLCINKIGRASCRERV